MTDQTGTVGAPAGDEPAVDTVICSACGEANPAALSWCEACGHDLTAEPRPTCSACGEAAVEADGYCHSCGQRQPTERDHLVVTDGPVVAVSDRGKRHHHNEDAVAVAGSDSTAVIVVCDGVSSTPGSAEVSMAAARAAVEVLSGAVADSDRAPTGVTEGGVGSPSGDGAVITEVLVEATRAAQRATLDTVEHADADDLNPPSTTFVAAVARRLEGPPESDEPTGAEVAVSVAWLGDSRAYWFDGDSARLLTEDHEIAGALTRWLGPDAGVGEPDVVHHRFPALESSSNSMLMVCSDGLWRYFAPEVGEPAASLLDRLGGEGLAGVDLAEALVGFANGNGGHDNVTVGLWPAASPASAGRTPNEPDQGEEATP